MAPAATNILSPFAEESISFTPLQAGGRRRLLSPNAGNERFDDQVLTFKPTAQSAKDMPINPLDLPIRRRFSPIIIFLMGRRGQGKTLTMTGFAKSMQERFRRSGLRRRVLSNYKLRFTPEGDSDPFILDRILSAPFDYKDSYICIDEISTAFPSARAMRSMNLEFGYFLTQIRKVRSELIFSTQFPQEVDRRILRQVDLFVRCERIAGGRHIRLKWIDWWGQFTGLDFLNRSWPPGPDEFDWETVFLNTNRLFNLYDSNEMVFSLDSDYREWGLAKQGYEIKADAEEGEELDLSKIEAPDATVVDFIRNQPDGANVRAVLRTIHADYDKEMKLDELKGLMERAGYWIDTHLGNKIIARKEQASE